MLLSRQLTQALTRSSTTPLRALSSTPSLRAPSSTLLRVAPEVGAALASGGAVVALESTIISHGLPWPRNLEMAREVEAVVRAAGAVPATVALSGGRVLVGLSDAELEALARNGPAARKTSRRDFASVLAGGGVGATTVAGTMIAAEMARIAVFVTGGIGGGSGAEGGGAKELATGIHGALVDG